MKFKTEGMQVKEIVEEEELSKSSAILLDEAQKRTGETDLLFWVLKTLLKQRTNYLFDW